MVKNRIVEITGTKYPFILGPMRLITLGEMAAAVSNSGGFGQIAASGLSSDRLLLEVKKARDLTDQPFGINIPLYRMNAFDALEIAIDAGIKTITTSAGNPAMFMKRIKEADLKVLHKVSSKEMALKAQSCGVDAVIATGFEAGGHVGRQGTTTMCLVPQLADALNIPVIAAGGIADARGVVAAFALGAEGVELGTRFVATQECPVPDFFKQLIVEAGSDSTILLGKDAMPIRVLRNRAVDMIQNPDKHQEDMHLRGADADAQYIQSGGDADTAVMPAGQISGLIKKIEKIDKIFLGLIQGTDLLTQQLKTMFGGG
ncbi:MAG: nitronate monooxygenase [Desulfobacteraceae bacterium]|nr:MAG: nitronate monooxygenase [Desulfobacteraceae bacterium]